MKAESPTLNPRPAIQLHIETLVLYGFAPADRHRIGEAVQRELTRLFVQRGTPPTLLKDDEMERLDGGTFRVTAFPKPQLIGEQVARAVFEGFK